MTIKYILQVSLFIVVFVMVSAAHPLGNFSVNQFSRIEIAARQISIRQVLEMAEIPTVNEIRAIDADSNGSCSQEELDQYMSRISPQYIAGLTLTVDGNVQGLAPVNSKAELRPGAGDLWTLRVYWDIAATVDPGNAAHRVEFKNSNYSGRIGWNEMMVDPAKGVSVYDSSTFANGISDELQSYPADSISLPLAERLAEFSFVQGTMPRGARPLTYRDGSRAATIQRDRLAELISVPIITPSIVLLGLFAAFGLGAMHAMSPGHGKTVVGAYLVGARGTLKHAAFLGMTVTVTHTLGVFVLGLITLFASNYILPESLMPVLGVVSGILVLYIGLSMFLKRLGAVLRPQTEANFHHHSHDKDHHHGHSHTHDHHDHVHRSHGGHTHSHGGVEHTHLPPDDLTWRSLLALGISGGLLPCPSALVLMLAAISLNRVGYGIVLTLVFSFGLAATLTLVGIAFLYLGRIFDRPSISENRLVKALPVFSAFVITCLGAAICYNSFAS